MAKVNIRPLSDRVVVKPLPAEEVTKSGLVIPDTAKERPQQGEVIAVGPGRITDDGKKIPMEVKVGDKVLYGKYAGTEISIDGEEFLIMRESDRLGFRPGTSPRSLAFLPDSLMECQLTGKNLKR
jgi:chaperonin GroES